MSFSSRDAAARSGDVSKAMRTIRTNLDITKNTTVTMCTEQLSTELGNEAVVLDMRNGLYYGLNPVAATIWKAVRQPQSVESLFKLLVQTYDADPAYIESDLLELLQDLARAGLVS